VARLSIPNVTLRPHTDAAGKIQYRPRYTPGPSARAKGAKPKDLKHWDGRWFSVQEAAAWAAKVQKAAADKAARGARRERREVPDDASLRRLFHDWLRSPDLAGVADGKMQRKALSTNTLRYYAQGAKVLESVFPLAADGPAIDLNHEVLDKVFNGIWKARGLHIARCVRSSLSAAISWGRIKGHAATRGLQANPVDGYRMAKPDERLRVGEPRDMQRLVAAADALGRPEIGDAIMLGLFTGQRQNDRLALQLDGLVNGRLLFVQHKTGARVAIVETPELAARLKAARVRRANISVKHVVWDEKADAPFSSWHYSHTFAKVRQAAVEGVVIDDVMVVPPTPGLAGFRDQDLRDTAVTWLAQAGCTVPEICAISGHSLESATSVLKHYLAMHPEMADTAMAKMAAWYAGKV
jgi:integrase